VQVTLLGVSIAIILALVAALIGPHFVDWNQYRPAFEAEASRLVGAAVRVTGAIEVRLLPTPSLGLHGVEVGAGENRARLRAGELSVEFALGPLLRGEIRAAEMRLVGPELNFGLDASGRIDGLGVAIGIDTDQLSIERLAVEMRALAEPDFCRTGKFGRPLVRAVLKFDLLEQRIGGSELDLPGRTPRHVGAAAAG